MDDTT